MHGVKEYGRDLKFVASGGLGDCLLVTPFLRHLARSGRYRRVVCAVPVGALEIFDRNPYVDKLIGCHGRDLFLWALPERDADVFSPYVEVEPVTRVGGEMTLRARPLQCANPKGIPILQQLARHFGFVPDDFTLEIHTEIADVRWAESRVSAFSGRPFVVINRETPQCEKVYPDALWQEIVDQLREDFLVVEFAASKTPLVGVHPVSPLPGIRASTELIRRAASLITVESFLGHLCAAIGVPAVVLFGPTNPSVYGHSINTNLSSGVCAPCADTARRDACVNHVCMASISPTVIADAVRQCVAQQQSRLDESSQGSMDKRSPILDKTGFVVH